MYNQKKVVNIEEGFDLIHKNDSDFSVVKLRDGTNYLYRATDKCIGPLMRCTGSTYSQEVIDRFINYANCMHDNSENSIFLDIGANIGTTSIYVKKKLSNIKVIGFEPGKENYDIFRINCILNQIDDIVIEKLALSDCEDMKYFRFEDKNPGGSCLISDMELGLECIKTVTLDSYLHEKKIDIHKIGYIWIDVEGMESDVIIGAQNLLKSKKIPLIQEFNPETYIAKGKAEKYTKIMKDCYDFFIDMNYEGADRIPISQLDDFLMQFKGQTDLFFC